MTRRIVPLAAIGALLLAAIAGGAYYYLMAQRDLPPGLASGNGRIEANEIDIATRYAARIVSVEADEGDLVEAGQVLVRLDTRELEAQLRGAEAQIVRASRARDESAAIIAQRRSELTLADKEYDRYLTLLDKNFASVQRVDQARAQKQTAEAALAAAESRLQTEEAAVLTAEAERDRLSQLVEDGTLTAPRSGRILYRLAQPGEVLGAGGKVLTLLDLTDVYMTIFLPSQQAAGIPLGASARILLDVAPDLPIPGSVSFVSPSAQFTPKQVETRSERERLMFRVKIRVPAELVTRHLDRVKTGVAGTGYVRLDPQATWPAWLESPLTTDQPKP